MLKALFFYTELADYTLSCFRALRDRDVEVHVVRWPVNPEAPFRFSVPGGIHVYERKDFSTGELSGLADKLRPDLLYCSGWIDRGYLKACRRAPRSITRVIGLDNKWEGTLRQKAASLAGRVTIAPSFDFAFVAGSLQKEFARRLGFDEERIVKGLYAADATRFESIYRVTNKSKKVSYPHRFLFAGRYVAFKGVFDLWEAFREMKEGNPGNDWELWCAGTGELFGKKAEHPAIRHFGFVQPAEMENIIASTGVYVLPSHREPWAVALHEMAIAGMPLLCSTEVGASEQFLVNGKNGFTFRPGDKEALREMMERCCAMPDEALMQMGAASHELGMTHTPDDWAELVLDMIERKRHVRN